MSTVANPSIPETGPAQVAIGSRAMVHLTFAGACIASVLAILFIFTWRLDQVPPYLNQDEAGFGLASYLLATTGRDYFGNWLPSYIVYFDHGELGNAMIVYWAMPFVKAMGLSIVSVRLAMVAAGILTLGLFGVLSWQLTRNRWLALAGVWMLATTPLFFIHSRILLDPLLTVPFIIGWLLCLVKLERTRDQRFLLLAAAILGVGAYSYSTARMLMPMYLALTLVVYGLSRQITWGAVATATGIFALLMVPALAFASQNTELYTNRFRELTWTQRPQPLEALVTSYLSHYLTYFDLGDLFATGASSLIHSTGRAGVFLLVSIPLALAGIVSLVARALRRRSRLALVLLTALISFPMFNALLSETHRPDRAAHVLPLYTIACLMGAQAIAGRLPRKSLAGLTLAAIVVLWVVEVTPFLWDYYTDYPARAVAAGSSNGNRPDAFRVIMESDPNQIYVDTRDPDIGASASFTFARFFQIAYGYKGVVHLMEPARAAEVAAGAMLLTDRPDQYRGAFDEVTTIPEIAPTKQHYSIMRKR